MRGRGCAFLGFALVCMLVNGGWSQAEKNATKMGFNHLGAEFGAYDVDASGGIKLGGVKKGGNRLGYPLGGQWRMALDPEKQGAQKGWSKQVPGDRTMTLPGTLDEAGVGDPVKPSLHVLTRTHEYIGMAWYQREVDIPETWKGKQVQLWLDRVMWESRLYIDGELVGSEDSLCTPHVYELGARLTPGKHKLTLRIDNSGRPGANCHGYGDDIQIKWNGVVGRMELIARDPVYVSSVRTIPDMANKRVRVLVKLANATGVTAEGDVALEARLRGSAEVVGTKRGYFKIAGAESPLELTVALDKNWRVWDEFDPALYELTATVRAEAEGVKCQDVSTVRFGMRELGQKGTQFTLNGHTVFLRGTHDGVGFPLLGHPAGDVESWRRVFRICKDYGLNHVRYHSICPNSPAFIAADEEGVILQPELPVWASIKEDWAGQAFLQREMERILEFYGNSPSFCLFSMGNEHAGDWDFLGRMVERAKRLDPTRRYAAASNEYIRPGDRGIPSNPNDDFATIMYGAEKNGERPRIRYMERMQVNNEDFRLDLDYRDILEGFKVPVIAHELGQWWTYPDFKEIDKYTGVLRAKNLEAFRESVKKAGMLDQNEALRLASGRLAVELYKEDIERELRTPGLGGFQLLDLHDYSGQGTALVGLLDAFWDSKGFVTPEAFRAFCAPTVVLARVPKQVWEEGEPLRVPLEVCHYGLKNLANAVIEWSFTTQKGRVLAKGQTPAVMVAQGGNTAVGVAALTVPAGAAEQVTLEARVAGTEIRNRWHVWTYPKTPIVAQGAEHVRVAEKVDEELLDFVEKGGRALVIADRLDCQVPVYFTNPIWTPQNNIETTGLLIQETHGALAEFPTASHSDFQWHSFLRPGRAFILNDLPQVKPVVQAIDAPSVMRNYRLATVVALRLGEGALVATSLNLREPLERRPEARQLRQSLINYLARGGFGDDGMVTRKEAAGLFDNPRFGTVAEPRGKIMLDVVSAGKAKEEGFKAWTPDADAVEVCKEGFGYRFEKTDTRWGIKPPGDLVVHIGEKVRAWSLNRCTLFVTCPKGFAGTVYLHFQDPENSGKRDGYVYGLGGAVMAGDHTGAGKWAVLRVRPEDSQTGEFPLYFRKLSYCDGWSTTPFVTRLVVAE